MSAFLSKELSSLGIKNKEILEDILLVENFLSKEELDILNNIIDTTPEEDWYIEYNTNLKRFCLMKFGRDDVENLVAEGKFEVTKGWDDKNLSILKYPIQQTIHSKLSSALDMADNSLELAGVATLQRMQDGIELKLHTDQHTDPSIRYATIIYLNDNYVGGELFFENFNFSIKPKAGSLLIFPGTEEFNHGVKHVQPGPIRYVIVGFIKVKNFYEEHKY